MLNAHEYNHSEFVNCYEIADFAKIYNFKDSSGIILGRNKIFRILRQLEILDKKNVPYQSYMKYFKTLAKEYFTNGHLFKKIIVFITPEGKTYLANKINDYLEKGSNPKIDNDNNKNIEVINKQSSPLDWDKEQAIAWCNNLPDFIKSSSIIYKELKEKWNF